MNKYRTNFSILNLLEIISNKIGVINELFLIINGFCKAQEN